MLSRTRETPEKVEMPGKRSPGHFDGVCLEQPEATVIDASHIRSNETHE